MNINGYDVTFKQDVVCVGCQTMENDNVLKLEKKLIDVDDNKVLSRGTEARELKAGEHNGKWFTAVIEGSKARGQVWIENGTFFLCQNTHDGQDANNKHGYDFSWTVAGGGVGDLEFNGVKKLRVYDENPYTGEEPKARFGEFKMRDGSVNYKDWTVSNDDVRKAAAIIREIKKSEK